MASYLSTSQLCEQTQAALGSRVTSIAECLAVWHTVGNVVKEQLAAGRGVKLPLLGTFTMTQSGAPTFVPSKELLTNYKLKAKAFAAAGSWSVQALNYSALAQASNQKIDGGAGQLTRELVEKIVLKVIQVLGKAILEGRDIVLTVHRVAELSFKGGGVSSEFMQDK